MSGRLDGCVALVIGATGGIGSATCRLLAREGASVVVAYHSRPEDAEVLLQELAGADHASGQASVDDSASLEALAAMVRDRFSRLDLLVNNAGITRYVDHADLDGLDDALFDWIFRVNVRGAFAAIRAFAPLLERSQDALVVNMSSIAGRTGHGSNVAYCASKAALDSITRSLGRALAPSIRVVSIAPGLVEGNYTDRLDPEWAQAQRDHTPLRRLATADDVARGILSAATDLAFTTGCVIPIDGGRPLT